MYNSLYTYILTFYQISDRNYYKCIVKTIYFDYEDV